MSDKAASNAITLNAILKKYTLILLLICRACRQSEPTVVKLTLNHTDGILKFSGIPPAVLADLVRDSIKSADWQSLIPVYRMPTDTTLKNYQVAIAGIYRVNSGVVIFKPDTAFAKNQRYFARYYRHDEGISLLDMIRGHKKPNEVTYTELIFKY